MISFEVFGGEKEAFKILNRLKLIKLAVSLGSNESLAQHPHSMTHADVPDEIKEELEWKHNLTYHKRLYLWFDSRMPGIDLIWKAVS